MSRLRPVIQDRWGWELLWSWGLPSPGLLAGNGPYVYPKLFLSLWLCVVGEGGTCERQAWDAGHWAKGLRMGGTKE